MFNFNSTLPPEGEFNMEEWLKENASGTPEGRKKQDNPSEARRAEEPGLATSKEVLEGIESEDSNKPEKESEAA